MHRCQQCQHGCCATPVAHGPVQSARGSLTGSCGGCAPASGSPHSPSPLPGAVPLRCPRVLLSPASMTAWCSSPPRPPCSPRGFHAPPPALFPALCPPTVLTITAYDCLTPPGKYKHQTWEPDCLGSNAQGDGVSAPWCGAMSEQERRGRERPATQPLQNLQDWYHQDASHSRGTLSESSVLNRCL